MRRVPGRPKPSPVKVANRRPLKRNATGKVRVQRLRDGTKDEFCLEVCVLYRIESPCKRET